MAIIVVDNHYLAQPAIEPLGSRVLLRLRRVFAATLGASGKANRSRFPDRVWARHSALLSAARANGRAR